MNEKELKKKKIKKAVITGIVTVPVIAVLIGLIIYCLWKRGFFLPDYITWNNQKDTFEIENERVDFILKKKILTIKDNATGEILYESPKEWLVSDYFYFDVDYDGENEVVMMVWKQGSFGEHKPFWHKGKDNKWTQHIFIYNWDSERSDRLDPRWMSSGLGINVNKVYIDEKNRVHFIDDEGNETVWQWLGWGLTLVEEIKK
ncbi:MAG: hypothetical protein IJ054_08700 [Lachnospiraceae bacterium]|nr:hypothetical protein [Lachnospiraceae bacterium]